MHHQPPPTTQDASSTKGRASISTPYGLILALLGIPLLMMLVVAMFAWPAARMEPRDLPFGIVGPAHATDHAAENLERNGFAINRYGDEASARDAITNRDVYGALLLSAQGPTLLTASAASSVVAQVLQEAVGAQLAANPDAPTAPLTIIDVVPATASDPRGAVLGASVMPLVLAGIVTGVAMTFISVPGWRRISGLIGVSVLAGLAVTLVIQTWLHAIAGNWWGNAGVLALIVLAIASVVAGGASILGPPGVAIGAVLMLFMGNPWSGIASAPELLPRWIGTIGQLLPPRAGGQLLRSTAFFDGAGSWMPLLVLLVWIGIGVTAVWVGADWQREQATAVEDASQPARIQLTTARQ